MFEIKFIYDKKRKNYSSFFKRKIKIVYIKIFDAEIENMLRSNV